MHLNETIIKWFHSPITHIFYTINYVYLFFGLTFNIFVVFVICDKCIEWVTLKANICMFICDMVEFYNLFVHFFLFRLYEWVCVLPTHKAWIFKNISEMTLKWTEQNKSHDCIYSKEHTKFHFQYANLSISECRRKKWIYTKIINKM